MGDMSARTITRADGSKAPISVEALVARLAIDNLTRKDLKRPRELLREMKLATKELDDRNC